MPKRRFTSLLGDPSDSPDVAESIAGVVARVPRVGGLIADIVNPPPLGAGSDDVRWDWGDLIIDELGAPSPDIRVHGTHNRSFVGLGGREEPESKYYTVYVGMKPLPQKFHDVEEVVRWTVGKNIDIAPIEKPNDPLAPQFRLFHRPTQEFVEQSEQALAQKWAEATPVYVRYGDIPESGFSENFADNRLEKGVSVYHGEFLPDSGELRVRPNTSAEVWSSLSIKNRPRFIVDGDLIGYGSDGEPVLENARVVRRMK